MSYQSDPVNRDIVVSGFASGIGDDPYTGPSDMKSVGLESVPHEASVAFATEAISPFKITSAFTVTSATATPGNVLTFTGLTGLENGMSVVFSATTVGGTTVGNCYWVANVAGTPPSQCTLYSDFQQTVPVSISGTGTATGSVFYMAPPQYFQSDGTHYFMVDSSGNVWSNIETTTSGKWCFMGNGTAQKANGVNGHDGNDTSNGNGLGIYGLASSGGTASLYLFVFSNSSVDYVKITAPYTWVYGWNPILGTTGNNAGVSSGFITPLGVNNPHQCILGPDANLYYLDAYNVVKIQTVTNATFDPTSTPSTYTPTTYNLLPKTDIAQCIASLGTNYLIGGMLNVVYAWDSTSNLSSYYILLAENNIKNLVTVNTNTYIFVGNRGRIWITNGSQAQIFKKIPDHISGTIDPLFVWGGATYNWNQLYFGLQAYNNAGTPIANYGGLWAIDLTTNAMRNVGQMSYGNYSGYVTTVFPKNTAALPPGYGLLMGWEDGSSNGGADESIGTPYTGGQSWVTSELIPVGLSINPMTPSQIEFKLSRPLVAGETIQLKVGTYLDPSYASFTSCTFNGASSFSTTGVISGITDGMPIDKFQWIIVQVILTSTASSPSYVRLTEFRIKNATSPITGYSSVQ